MTDPIEPKTVLCFGDSQTWGFDPRRGAETVRYPFHERWTQRLGAKLGPGYHIIEEGLNGRTTVFDDPAMGDRSGLAALPFVLASHMPIDLLVIMLGSNDVKTRFNLSGDEIARCLGRLLDYAKKSECGPSFGAPEMLIVVPPPMGVLEGTWLETLFEAEGGHSKIEKLRQTYPEIATFHGAHCFDTHTVVEPGKVDGVHFDPDALDPLAEALSQIVRDILYKNH